MKKYLDKFYKLPFAYRGVAALVLIGLIMGAFYQFIYSDLNTSRNELLQKIQDTEDQIQSQQKTVRNLPKIKKEVEELDQKLGLVLRELPDAKEIERFLRSISVLAADTGMEVIEFIPQREVRQGFISRIPVSMKMEGTFHQLATFFDEVGHLPRIVNLSDISINIISETPQEVVVQALCTATTYRYLEKRTGAAAGTNPEEEQDTEVSNGNGRKRAAAESAE